MKRKRDLFILIFSLIIGLFICYFSIKEILSNQSIEWCEITPFLWLGLSILIISLNLFLYYKTEWYFIISISLWVCLFSYFCIGVANKPGCNLTSADYIYRGKIKNYEVGNAYSIYLKRLDYSIYKTENDLEELNEYVSLQYMYGNAKNGILKNIYNDTLKNKDSSDVISIITSTLQVDFIKDYILNTNYETFGTAQLLTDNKFKTVKYLEKVPAVLFKNGQFYRYKLLSVTPKMITDSAGIIIVNFGEISFE